jgi:hypothetical protein
MALPLSAMTMAIERDQAQLIFEIVARVNARATAGLRQLATAVKDLSALKEIFKLIILLGNSALDRLRPRWRRTKGVTPAVPWPWP